MPKNIWNVEDVAAQSTVMWAADGQTRVAIAVDVGDTLLGNVLAVEV